MTDALLLDHLADKFLVGDGCWEWIGYKDRDGYGFVKNQLAHRLIYTLMVGPIPDGLTLDHLCRNRGCVRPAHLEPVTQRENTLRGHTIPALNLQKTHCKQGHAFDAANTYIFLRGGYMRRSCRACNRESQRQRRQA